MNVILIFIYVNLEDNDKKPDVFALRYFRSNIKTNMFYNALRAYSIENNSLLFLIRNVLHFFLTENNQFKIEYVAGNVLI